MKRLALLLLTLGPACSGGTDDTSDTDADADTDTDTDTDTDSDTDSDTDTDTDTDTEPPTAAEGRLGTGLITGEGYFGTEEWYLIGDRGDGEDLCRIRYSLTSILARTDCPDCNWAYDLEISGAEIIGESGPGCAGTFGLDATTVSSLDGTVYSYGYVAEYFGHAQVLMVEQEGVWDAVSFGDMDMEAGTFAYDWETGYREY